MKKTFLLIAFLPFILAALNCSECSKVIRSRYLKSGNRIFCSNKCFEKTLPKCERCSKPCVNGVRSMLNRTFCSQKCMKAVFKCAVCRQGLTELHVLSTPDGKSSTVCNLCVKKEKCYYCMLPGADTRLDAIRAICRNCRSSAVTDGNAVRKIFNSLRNELAYMFNFDDSHKISLHIVNAPALEKISGNTYSPAGARKIAMMQFQQEITEKSYAFSKRKERKVTREICKIFIVDSTPEKMLKDALAHELAHDHLRHNTGAVRDLTAEEGFCELVAALYNEKTGNGSLNRYKDVNKDPVYGGGYRKMRAIYDRTRSLEQTMKYVK